MNIPLFLDFDDTLYDTATFKSLLKQLFLDLGLSDAEYTETKNSFPSGTYNPVDHANRAWKVIPPTFETELAALYSQGKQFIHPDALLFLEHLDTNHYEPIILTFGSDSFQRKKIAGSGLDVLIPKIFTCQENKWEAIGKHVTPKSPFILIDDRTDTIVMLAQSHPDSYGVILDRNIKEPHGQFPRFQVITDFTELRTLPMRFPQLLCG